MTAREIQVQDDSREVMISTHCGLTHVPDSRSNVNTPDAYDENGNPYELKSATRNSVTTARDVGLATIQSWREKYWIVAKGRNLRKGFEIECLYIAHPRQLEPFFGRIETRLQEDWSECEQVLNGAKQAGVNPSIITKVEAMLQRGITLNNPHIPMRLIEQTTPLDPKNSDRARQQLIEFVTANPLDG